MSFGQTCRSGILPVQAAVRWQCNSTITRQDAASTGTAGSRLCSPFIIQHFAFSIHHHFPPMLCASWANMRAATKPGIGFQYATLGGD